MVGDSGEIGGASPAPVHACISGLAGLARLFRPALARSVPMVRH